MAAAIEETVRRKRKSRASTGRAGALLVLDELFARGVDAHLADRHDSGEILIRMSDSRSRRVRVRAVHFSPWYVNVDKFVKGSSDRVAVYVLLGSETTYPRFFVARNRDLVTSIRQRAGWKDYGFIDLEAVQAYEDNWNAVTR